MKICLLTPGQPSTNPRLVKEADALTEAGHEVHVLCAYWVSWAAETDKVLLASRSWSCAYVGGYPNKYPLRYGWTRLRHSVSRRSIAFLRDSSVFQRWALCRVLPELERAAKSIPADLYIAHNLGALPAAVAAAQKYNSRVGFDSEDFHTGERPPGTGRSVLNTVAGYFEGRYLSQCDYITAASPGIAEAYAAKYRIPRPVPILNVFPLSQAPQQFRSSKESDPLTLYWFSQTMGANRGLEDVVQAMGALRGCGVVLHLRGNWQRGYREQLFAVAASAGLEPEQIIAHAPEPPDEMVRLASLFDVGLALEPGRDENNQIALSNKIFTYLLAGNAVIATATKGQRPVIEAIGAAGFFYEPGDVNTLVRRLKMWFEDRTSLEEARRQAWDWGTREYNWDLEKKKFLRVVETVLTASAKRVS